MHKKISFIIRVVIVLALGSVYLRRPDFFSLDILIPFFEKHIWWGLVVYFILGTLRGLTLLPSTPMVLAGILIFPPWPLFLVNMLCVFSSSAIVYKRSHYLGFDTYFHKNYPESLKKIKKILASKELGLISLWAFLPFVPTDLICYASATLRIKMRKCLIGVAIGEGVICALYIFGGSEILSLLI